jgi:hypothetical protein
MRTSLRWQSPGNLALVGVVAPPAVPAFVQSASANSGGTEVTTQNVTLAAPATAGNLLVMSANCDSTIPAPSGFTLAVSAINAQACYLWYKTATGGETTIAVAPTVARVVVAGIAEYSGIAASPLDATATNTGTVSTSGPVSAGSTGSTAQAAELVVAVTGPHGGFVSATAPTSPTWTNSYVNRVADNTADSVNPGRNAALFMADLVVAATGTQSTSTSWTNAASDWGAVIATFKGA